MMTKTPIYDFVKNYINNEEARFHMPGHKGKEYLGFEKYDITEIDGADVLYHPTGIIKESEAIASSIFGCDIFYSTEGSSLAIRAMLYLAYTNREKNNERPFVLATRNVHKTFITAATLLDFDVKWIISNNDYYHTQMISSTDLEKILSELKVLPFAVYVTSPDYLGNILDIKGIAKVCAKYNVPLLVDNAHGAYLKFLSESLFPTDLGATMCASSAHKTLPVLTGGAYLAINSNASDYYKTHANDALSLFASTSPSYLILESLDVCNSYLANNGFIEAINTINSLKNRLTKLGYRFVGVEGLKITIDAKAYGYTGYQISNYLKENKIEVEFTDYDFVVLMPTPSNINNDFIRLEDALTKLEKKEVINGTKLIFKNKKQEISIRDAVFSKSEIININEANNRVLASSSISCPPAIPIVIAGERIVEEDIKMLAYYGIEKVSVVKK